MTGILFLASFLGGLVLLCAFLQIVQQRVTGMLVLSQIAALALVFLAILQGLNRHDWWLYVLAAIIFAAHFMAFPWVIRRLLRQFNVPLEFKRGLPLLLAMMVGLLAVFLAMMGGLPLAKQVWPPGGGALSLALAVILLGMWLIILQSQHLGQMIGFLTFENGLVLALINAPGLGWGVDIALIALLVVAASLILFRIRRHYASLAAIAEAMS